MGVSTTIRLPFPKLDVTGSIPVARSKFLQLPQEVYLAGIFQCYATRFWAVSSHDMAIPAQRKVRYSATA